MNRMLIAVLSTAVSVGFAAPGFAQAPDAKESAAVTAVHAQTGLAAVYSARLNGHRTANGQVYDPNKLTAAHKTLPFGTKVKVSNTRNGKSVIVRINDRGPKQAGRVLDLTPRAAHALGIRRLGMGEVSVEVQS